MLGHPQNYVLLPMPCLGVYGFFMSCNYVTDEVQRNRANSDKVWYMPVSAFKYILLA